MKKKSLLNGKEREILRILHKQGGGLTINKIVKETGYSFVTVKKYIKKLLDKKVIEVIEES